MQAMITDNSKQVELFISCRNLINRDVFSKSDPQVFVYIQKTGKWVLHGKTEKIKDNLNPTFAQSFVIDYFFETHQFLKFDVVDVDEGDQGDFLGSCQIELGKIVGAKNQIQIIDLICKNGSHKGKLIAKIEEVGTSTELYNMTWRGSKLMNTDGIFGKSDPLLRFFKKTNMGNVGGGWLKVHETEWIKDNLNPVWKPFMIGSDKFCGGDIRRTVKVECWDWESNGEFQYIGEAEFTMEDVLVKEKRKFELYNFQKKKNSGTLELMKFESKENFSFVSYLRGGWQLSVICAIDFTGSNGIVTSPSSLHALNSTGMPNQYQETINAVCSILLNYDYDKNVPVYGFGGKPHFPTMNSTQTLHCFPLTGIPSNAEVSGLPGIMQCYTNALRCVELSGPTHFHPIIEETKKVAMAHKSNGNAVYSILLILTDGVIHDMDATIEAIINSAFLPLSIIIVGVGNEDFESMEVLDGDQGLRSNKGQKEVRDLVQFVPFRKFKNNSAELQKEVLAEIPTQFTEYMKFCGIKPAPPSRVDISQLVPTTQTVIMGQQPLVGAGTQLLGGILGGRPNTLVQQPVYQQQPLQQQPLQPQSYPVPQTQQYNQQPIFTNFIQQQIPTQQQPQYQGVGYPTMGQQQQQPMQQQQQLPQQQPVTFNMNFSAMAPQGQNQYPGQPKP
jgi:hypothetical protein